MEVAQRSISSAIAGLGSMLSDQQQIAQNGIDRVNEANVQAFMDRLQSARTPEEVAALQQSGELDALRSTLTAKDLARVRGAEDTRVASLMQQMAARTTFDSQQAAAKAAPIRDQIMSLYMSGDPVKQAEAKALLDTSPIGQKADVLKAMNDFDQTKATRDLNNTLNPLKIQEAQNRIAADEAARAAQEEQRKLVADQRNALLAQAKLDAEKQALKENGNIYSDGVLSPGDSQEISDALIKAGVKDAGDRTDIIKAIFRNAMYTAEGVDANGNKVTQTVPLPKRVAMDAALSAYNGWFSTAGGSADKAIKKLMDDVREYELAGGSKAKLSKAAVDYRDFQELLQRRQGQAPIVPLKPK
jgi:hypothetical protein